MTNGEAYDEHPHEAANEVTGRLRALGAEPVPEAVMEHHLAAMRAASAGDVGAAAGATSALVPAARESRVRQRIGIAAAFAVGLLVGSTGLAYAGALPGPAQDGMATVLGTVGLDVPRSTSGCPAGAAYKNHGQYVEEVKAAGGDVEAASKSDCGKPEPSVGKGGGNGAPDDTPGDDPGNGNGNGKGNGKAKGAGKHAGDPCKGKPPWAGDKTKTEAEKDALDAQREAACPDDADEADESDDANKPADTPPPSGEVPPTTAPVAPTTPVPSSAAPTTPPAPPTTVSTTPPPRDPAISALPPAAG